MNTYELFIVWSCLDTSGVRHSKGYHHRFDGNVYPSVEEIEAAYDLKSDHVQTFEEPMIHQVSLRTIQSENVSGMFKGVVEDDA